MAKPVPKKKRKDDDDEEQPKKKKGAKVAATEDEDEDEDEDEEEEEDDEDASDSDDDEDADEDSDDDDEEDSDDADDDDDDEDESDDDDSDDDDEESAGGISWDTDDAEAGGLPEGRCVLKNPRTRLASTAQYNEDDADGVPVLTIDCVPPEGDPFVIHLTAGKPDRILPTDDGTDFKPAPGSKAKGLSKSSNTFYFIKSLEDAGFPKKKLRANGIAAIDGTDVELVRVPQPKRRGLAADDEEQKERTMPSVSEVHSFPWDKKGAKARDAATAALKSSKKGKKGKPTKKGKKGGKSRPKAEAPKRSAKSDGAIIETTEKFVLKALSSEPASKKGIPAGNVYNEVFHLVKKHPERNAIMELVGESDFMTADERPWAFDDKLERYTRV